MNKFGKQKLKEIFMVRSSWGYSEFGKIFYKTILEKAKTENMLQISNGQTGYPANAKNLAAFILNLIAQKSKELAFIISPMEKQ